MNGPLEEDQVSVGDSQAGTGMEASDLQATCVYE